MNPFKKTDEQRARAHSQEGARVIFDATTKSPGRPPGARRSTGATSCPRAVTKRQAGSSVASTVRP